MAASHRLVHLQGTTKIQNAKNWVKAVVVGLPSTNGPLPVLLWYD
jgi:hypothetical protein